MKNLSRISKMSLCALCMIFVTSVQAQEVARLDNMAKTELSTIQKTTVQSYTVKGKVIDQDNLPLAGVNVVLKGSSEGVVTDLDGTFEFSRKLEVDDVLIFSYIGYNPQEYTVVASESDTIDLTITFDLSNISLMGAVEVDGVYKTKRNVFQKFFALFK